MIMRRFLPNLIYDHYSIYILLLRVLRVWKQTALSANGHSQYSQVVCHHVFETGGGGGQLQTKCITYSSQWSQGQTLELLVRMSSAV